MPTEFAIKYEANTKISDEDMTDLFCAIGQGSGYWAMDVEIGNIPKDSDGQYIENPAEFEDEWKWEAEGCAAWACSFKLDDPITLLEHNEGDSPTEITDKKISDLLIAIEKICSDKTSISWEYASQIAEAFKPMGGEIDMGQIDAELADLIFQITVFGKVVYA